MFKELVPISEDLEDCSDIQLKRGLPAIPDKPPSIDSVLLDSSCSSSCYDAYLQVEPNLHF